MIVSSIVTNDSKVIDGVSMVDFQASLDGKTIVVAHHKGKNMWIQIRFAFIPFVSIRNGRRVYIKASLLRTTRGFFVSDVDKWCSKYFKLYLRANKELMTQCKPKRKTIMHNSVSNGLICMCSSIMK
ncbi:hypothetical protein Scep_015247 [Stephania cephalantha]|uniref:Uncharacterized protein n=1 Tax=Stephania cephalantha TaxID=152367 RepID=A0AAP0P3R5_9MAGN